MKSRVNQHVIQNALRGICDPDMVQSVNIDGKSVTVIVSVNPDDAPNLEPMRLKAEQAVADVKGVKKAAVILTAETVPEPPQPSSRPKPLEIPNLLPDVKHLIAVASGKGGVGKSTVTKNLALALHDQGVKVGILDADIYGPSQPRMMGLEGQKPGGTEGKIDPLDASGIKVMSIGFMVDASKSLVWRGPMVQSALVQLMRDVDWGTLDVLLIDMPPGTGDAQLTMAQKVNLTGAIIVSTPQDIALIDARKAVDMFQKTDVPILGMIENMSTHVCTNCGHEEHIFGHDGAKTDAERMGIPFLGAIPLHRDIREHADTGVLEVNEAFTDIAKQITKTIEA